MLKSVISCVFAVTALLAVSFVSETDAVLCESAQRVWHLCVGEPHEVNLGSQKGDDVSAPNLKKQLYWVRSSNDVTAPKCYTRFCKAGPLSSDNCGVDCNGAGPGVGCDHCIESNGTPQCELVAAWKAKYGLVMQDIHNQLVFHREN